MDYIAYLHKDRKSDFGVTSQIFLGALRLVELFGRSAAQATRSLELSYRWYG